MEKFLNRFFQLKKEFDETNDQGLEMLMTLYDWYPDEHEVGGSALDNRMGHLEMDHDARYFYH